MPVSFVVESLSQRRGVDKVAIVGHADAVRAVHVERLSLRIGTAASSRVSQVAEAHEARQVRDPSALLEHLGGETVALALVEPPTSAAGDDTSRILASVLKQIKRLVKLN